MKVKRIVVTAHMFVVILVGGLLSGCGEQLPGASNGQDQSARDQFLAERRGTVTPGADLPGGVAMSGTFGSVEKVEGNKVTVKSPIDNSTSVVELAAGGKVTKQVDGKVSDIKVGDTLTAVGSKEGDDLVASNVSLGDSFMSGGAPVSIGKPSSDMGGNGAPTTGDEVQVAPRGEFQPGGGQGQVGDMAAGGSMIEVAAGTVEKVEGSTLTVKTQSGTATVRLNDGTKVQKQTEIKLSDLKVGEMIMAAGSYEGTTFKAKTISVQGAMMSVMPGLAP